MRTNERPWRDFVHTVEVMMARAFAKYERDHDADASTGAEIIPFARSPESRRSHRFVLERLAAAGAERLSLKSGELYTRDGTITGRFTTSDGFLRMAFQLKGYALLSVYANKEARLVYSNGAESQVFRFDDRGSARVDIPEDEAVSDGLGHVTLEFVVE